MRRFYGVAEGASDAQAVPLTDLLARLLASPGTAVSREALICDVWDENWFGSTKTLDVHVAALRRRLAEFEDVSVPAITTLPGFGYRLD